MRKVLKRAIRNDFLDSRTHFSQITGFIFFIKVSIGNHLLVWNYSIIKWSILLSALKFFRPILSKKTELGRVFGFGDIRTHFCQKVSDGLFFLPKSKSTTFYSHSVLEKSFIRFSVLHWIFDGPQIPKRSVENI